MNQRYATMTLVLAKLGGVYANRRLGECMRVSYCITAAGKALVACLFRKPSTKATETVLRATNIFAGQGLRHFGARVRSPSITASGFFVIATFSACTPQVLKENALEQISTLEDMRYRQLLTNISSAIANPDAVPNQAVTSQGTATSSDTGMFALQFGAHAQKQISPTVSTVWQDNWTITPVADPQDLRNLRAIYGLLYRTDADVVQVINNAQITWGGVEFGPEFGPIWPMWLIVEPRRTTN